MIPVRNNHVPEVTRVFEPLDPAHPLYGSPCPACDEPIHGQQRLALVYIGPGDDPEDQAKARDGRWHTGAAVAVHAACAGIEGDEAE